MVGVDSRKAMRKGVALRSVDCNKVEVLILIVFIEVIEVAQSGTNEKRVSKSWVEK